MRYGQEKRLGRGIERERWEMCREIWEGRC